LAPKRTKGKRLRFSYVPKPIVKNPVASRGHAQWRINLLRYQVESPAGIATVASGFIAHDDRAVPAAVRWY
jgi:hypothetical protein